MRGPRCGLRDAGCEIDVARLENEAWVARLENEVRVARRGLRGAGNEMQDY